MLPHLAAAWQVNVVGMNSGVKFILHGLDIFDRGPRAIQTRATKKDEPYLTGIYTCIYIDASPPRDLPFDPFRRE